MIAVGTKFGGGVYVLFDGSASIDVGDVVVATAVVAMVAMVAVVAAMVVAVVAAVVTVVAAVVVPEVTEVLAVVGPPEVPDVLHPTLATWTHCPDASSHESSVHGSESSQSSVSLSHIPSAEQRSFVVHADWSGHGVLIGSYVSQQNPDAHSPYRHVLFTVDSRSHAVPNA